MILAMASTVPQRVDRGKQTSRELMTPIASPTGAAVAEDRRVNDRSKTGATRTGPATGRLSHPPGPGGNRTSRLHEDVAVVVDLGASEANRVPNHRRSGFEVMLREQLVDQVDIAFVQIQFNVHGARLHQTMRWVDPAVVIL